MDSVHVNDASRAQLAALLGLTTPQIEVVIAARPFSSVAQMAAALPPRLRDASDLCLVLPKLDINRVTERQLVRRAGFCRAVARRIVAGRPYYFMRELDTVPGLGAARETIPALFAVAQLHYVDKLTGHPITLDPDMGHVVLGPGSGSHERVSDDAESLTDSGLIAIDGPRDPSGYCRLAVPETESSPDRWAQLHREHPDRLVPSFIDASHERRYLDPDRCVVQFRRGLAASDLEALIAALRVEVCTRHGGGLMTLRLPPGDRSLGVLSWTLARLNESADVCFAEPNYLGFDDAGDFERAVSPPASADDETAIHWNLTEIGVDPARATGAASGRVVIAIIDSGVDDQHPALAGAIMPRRPDDDWDFASDLEQTPNDDSGHGTFIAGLLVGNGALGVQGICPGATVLPLKVPLHSHSDAYIRRRQAILYALDRVEAGQRLVINLSWKTSGDTALIRDAIATAVERGAVVVASAGNWPVRRNQPHFPSDYPVVISVAAIDRARARADYSYYGDEVDLAAPGGDATGDGRGALVSAAPRASVTHGAGTSFAAPHITGVAALLLAARPELSVTALRHALESTATSLSDVGLGRGLVNAAAAMESIMQLATSLPDTPNSVYADVLDVLRWRPRPDLHDRLQAGLRARLAERWAQQCDRFVRAGVGRELVERSQGVTPEGWDRIFTAPSIAHQLLHRPPTDLRLMLHAVRAELCRHDPPRRLDEPVWSAMGDLYLPAGRLDPAQLRPHIWEPWHADRPYAAARIDERTIVDFESPHATKRMDGIVTEYEPYTPGQKRALILKFRAGMDRIRQLKPVAALVTGHTRSFVLRRDPSRTGWSNSSYELFIGRVVCVNPERRAVDLAEITETIVHESIHSFIYVIEEDHPLIPDRDASHDVTARSEWSGRKLQLHAFVHACFVWYGLWQFWQQAEHAGVFPRDVAQKKATEARHGFLQPELCESLRRVRPWLSPGVADLLIALAEQIRAEQTGVAA